MQEMEVCSLAVLALLYVLASMHPVCKVACQRMMTVTTLSVVDNPLGFNQSKRFCERKFRPIL